MRNSRYIAPVVFILMIVVVLLVAKEIQSYQVPLRVYLYLLMILFGAIILAGLWVYFPGKKEDLKKYKEDLLHNQDISQPALEVEVSSDDANDHQVILDLMVEKISRENHEKFGDTLLQELAGEFDAVQGLYFALDREKKHFTKIADYAYFSEIPPREFIEGETISGQVAKNKMVLKITDIPEGYITVLSGLGSSSPSFLVIVPLIYERNCIGITELAFFREPGGNEMRFFELLSERAGSEAGIFYKLNSSGKSK